MSHDLSDRLKADLFADLVIFGDHGAEHLAVRGHVRRTDLEAGNIAEHEAVEAADADIRTAVGTLVPDFVVEPKLIADGAVEHDHGFPAGGGA